MQETEKYQEVLTYFAVGLVQQCVAIYQGQSAAVTNLNLQLRTGWEKLSFLCYAHGITPPLTLADLVAWLHKPLAEWGIDFPTGWADKTLLQDAVPTEFCEELGADKADVDDLRLEIQDATFRELHEYCRNLGDTALYSALREFLIQNPLLDDLLPAIQHNRLWPQEMRNLLRRCFESIPAACIKKHDGQEWIAVCPHCGWTLAWAGDTPFCHRNGMCESIYGEGLEGLRWRVYDHAMCRTTEGIQRYVVAPEVTLLTLRAADPGRTKSAPRVHRPN